MTRSGTLEFTHEHPTTSRSHLSDECDEFSPRIESALVGLLMAILARGLPENDAITQAQKADKINGVAVPSIEETKAIAEEGFLYGLPIVMNYTSMYNWRSTVRLLISRRQSA